MLASAIRHLLSLHHRSPDPRYGRRRCRHEGSWESIGEQPNSPVAGHGQPRGGEARGVRRTVQVTWRGKAGAGGELHEMQGGATYCSGDDAGCLPPSSSV
jgi:hypothetical protein